jgi:hypothetical protein
MADNHSAQLGIDDQAGQPANLDIHDNLCFAFEPEQLCLNVGLNRPPRGQNPVEYVSRIGTLANNIYARPIDQPEGIATAGYPNAGNAARGHNPDRRRQDYGAFDDYPGGGVVAISWAGQFLSLDMWQKSWGQDWGTKKAARSVGSIRDLRIEHNPTRSTLVRSLPGTFEDAFGGRYVGSITLKPYSSAVLMRAR